VIEKIENDNDTLGLLNELFLETGRIVFESSLK
jgi:hypothetical protein